MHFDEADVVRHYLVQRIVRAYDEHKTRIAEQQMLLLGEPKNAEAAAAEKPPSVAEPVKSSSTQAGE